jgi:hypothetical protein
MNTQAENGKNRIGETILGLNFTVLRLYANQRLDSRGAR